MANSAAVVSSDASHNLIALGKRKKFEATFAVNSVVLKVFQNEMQAGLLA